MRLTITTTMTMNRHTMASYVMNHEMCYLENQLQELDCAELILAEVLTIRLIPLH